MAQPPVKLARVRAYVKDSVCVVNSVPCSLEDAKQPSAAQNADAECRHDVTVTEDRFHYTAQHDETVETVEQRHEVALQAETVHLEHHLHREQSDEEHIRYLCQCQQRCDWSADDS